LILLNWDDETPVADPGRTPRRNTPFYKRRAQQPQGGLNCRPNFVGTFTMKSVRTQARAKVMNLSADAHSRIPDYRFPLLEFHFGKAVIL
jgi:hypothetical protein